MADHGEALACELQRECEQLKFRLSLEREARQTERRRMADHGEALACELQRDEVKLRQAESEVEEMRGLLLQQDGLERWQVEQVQSLRQEILNARQTASSHTAAYEEQLARLRVVCA